MKLIDRYIISRIALWLAVILLFVASFYVLIDLLTRTRTGIVEHGTPAPIVCLYYLNYLPVILLQTAPVAFLIASLFVLGTFARNNEYAALLSGGVSFYRFAIAPVALSALVTVCAMVLGEYALPSASRRAEYLLKTYMKSKNPPREIPMAWSRPDLGLTYAIRRYDPVSRSGREIMITKRVGGTVTEKVEADTAVWDDLRQVWILEGATVINVDAQTEKREKFDRIAAPIYETPNALDAGRRPADEKSFRELYGELTRLARSGLVYPDKWVDLHAKLALPMTNFIIFFLAMPFALRVKRSGLATSFAISIGIGIAYMTLLEAGQALGRSQYLIPWVAAWAPDIVFLAVGLYLTSKVER